MIFISKSFIEQLSLCFVLKETLPRVLVSREVSDGKDHIATSSSRIQMVQLLETQVEQVEGAFFDQTPDYGFKLSPEA